MRHGAGRRRRDRRSRRRAGYLYQEGGILSPDGHCRAFDAQRAGHGRSATALGIVVLKRLAERAGRRRPYLRGDQGLGDQQRRLAEGRLHRAERRRPGGGDRARRWRIAGVDAETISYIEAHGTGTALGDPIEIAALTQAFRAQHRQAAASARSARSRPTSATWTRAAGVAGLIKTVLALQHRQHPAQPALRAPNPQIDFANSPFYVNTALADWPAERRTAPRRRQLVRHRRHQRARRSSKRRRRSPPAGPSRPWQLLVLSARTADRAGAGDRQSGRAISSSTPTSTWPMSPTRSRSGARRSTTAACWSAATATTRWRALEARDPQRVLTDARRSQRRAGRVHVPRPGRAVCRTWPASSTRPSRCSASTIDRCAELLQPHLGLDLREVLYPDLRIEDRRSRIEDAESSILDPLSSILDQTQYAQPALFAVEYALAQLWMALGRAAAGDDRPQHRRVCRRLPGRRLLAGGCAGAGRGARAADAGAARRRDAGGRAARAELRPLLGAELSLAAVNGPALCVVSGPCRGDRRRSTSSSRARDVQLPAAAHLARLPLGDDGPDPGAVHRRGAQGALASAGACPISPTSPAPGSRPSRRPTQATGRATCASRCASRRGCEALLAEPERLLLEVGPGHTLGSLCQQHPACEARAGGAGAASLPPPASSSPISAFVLATLGKLWLAGVAVDWRGLYAGERRQRCPCRPIPSSASATGRPGARTCRRGGAPAHAHRQAAGYRRLVLRPFLETLLAAVACSNQRKRRG